MLTSASTNKNKDRLLIVDAETMACELLQLKFNDEGYAVDLVHDGRQALELDLTVYSLVLVDLMNQPFTGLDFTHELKRDMSTYQIPVIVMSEQRSVDDVVNALDAGADDFVAKPFSARELVARAKSLLRRHRIMMGRKIGNEVIYKGISLDLVSGAATIDGELVSLSRTEFLILAMFLRHRNQFFDREEIQKEARDGDTAVSDRAVDTNISRLRKKIGAYGRNIVNRHGYGYGFVE